MRKILILLVSVLFLLLSAVSCDAVKPMANNSDAVSETIGTSEIVSASGEETTTTEKPSTTAVSFEQSTFASLTNPQQTVEETTASIGEQKTYDVVATQVEETEPQIREHKHVVIEEWKIAADKHYKLCGICFEIVEESVHEWEFVSLVQKGNATLPSIKRYGCKICHHTMFVQSDPDGTETITFDKLPVR